MTIKRAEDDLSQVHAEYEALRSHLLESFARVSAPERRTIAQFAEIVWLHGAKAAQQAMGLCALSSYEVLESDDLAEIMPFMSLQIDDPDQWAVEAP